MANTVSNIRPAPDAIMVNIADYAAKYVPESKEAIDTARYCFMDTLGCALLALRFPECTKHLGPIVPGALLANGARVPGTDWQLEPVHAAFNIGAMIRWLDFNDTWLAAEWGHPSDNLGGILALADYLCRTKRISLTIGDVLHAMIKAHEIQGILALENSFNRIGLDHVLLVRVATAAVAATLLGGSQNKSSALSPTPGPTAVACAFIVTRQTPARASPGLPVMLPAGGSGWRSWRCKGKWVTHLPYRQRLGDSTMPYSREKRSVYADP